MTPTTMHHLSRLGPTSCREAAQALPSLRHGLNDPTIALGRGDYRFMGSVAGGQRAAAIDSLVQTGKANGLDPEAYLREVLGCMADHPICRIQELLPWNIGTRKAVGNELQCAA